jgi:hypothetical protein
LNVIAPPFQGQIQWSTDNVNFTTPSSAPVPTTTDADTQIYYVRYINNETGCIGASSSITVTVFALPTVTATADPNAICVGESSELTADGADSYTWNQGLGSGASFEVAPLTTTVYTVTGTEGHSLVSCTNTASVTVTVNPLPVITITTVPSNATICSGNTVSLTAAAGANMSYVWSTGETTAMIDTILYNNGSVPVSVTYSVIATNTITGCTATATTTVTVNPLPIASITPAETSICLGKSTDLTANGGESYIWTGGSTNTSITVSPVTNTTYYVTATNSYGCTATASATVTVNPLPEVTITSDETDNAICYGEDIVLTADGGESYSWNGGSTDASITVSPLVTTTYSVTATNSFGCTNTASITVTVNPLPDYTVTPTSQVICFGQSATFTASGSYNFLWSPGGETTNSITVSPEVGPHTYTVMATNAVTGCQKETTVSLTVNPLRV